MSVKWISHVLDCSPYRGTTLLMHMVLADHANDEGICWPSVNRLAKLCRIRRRRAQQILDQLRDDRMYEAERRAGHSTLFRLLTIGGEEDCTPDQSNGEEDCTPGVKGIAPRGEEDCTPGVKPTAPRTVIEPPKEPSEESSGIFYSDQTFWVQTLTAILQTYYKGQESGDFAEYWQPTVAFQHLNGKVSNMILLFLTLYPIISQVSTVSVPFTCHISHQIVLVGLFHLSNLPSKSKL